MKYVQYELDRSCWHVIGLPAGDGAAGTEHNYDTTFCDGIWMNDKLNGSFVETDEPIDKLFGQICSGCIAEMVLLEMFPRPEIFMLNGKPCRSHFQIAWNGLGEVERKRYLQVVYQHLIRVNG